jgi:hypothetical protein
MVALSGGPALVLALVALGAAPAGAGPDRLEPPANLRVTEMDHTSVTVEWDPTGWAHRYTVIWTPGPPPEWVGWLETDGTVATFPVTSPGAPHTVTVVAQRGGSQVSSTIGFVVPDAPPPPVPPTPEDVQASVSPGSVTVQWEPSVVDGEEADAYVVRWTPDHSGTVTTDTSIIRNLPSGGDLEITVTARNDAGEESDPSAPLGLTVPPAEEWEPLGPPTNLKVVADDDDNVTLIEWDPPTGGVDPVTYKLNYRFADQDLETWIAESSEPFIDVPAQIGELIVCPPDANPGQTWIIWVTAHSDGETSPRSEEATVCLAS